jgi:hypothetical protein
MTATAGYDRHDLLAAYLGGALPQAGRDGRLLPLDARASLLLERGRQNYLPSGNPSIANARMRESSQAAGEIELQEQTLRGAGGMETFPMVLHRALAEVELVAGGSDVASFLPSGDAFIVKKQLLFQEQVLPLFFPKMKSFASFQRQLNLYDFKRVGGAGPDRGAYQHKDFVRAYPTLSSRMKRTKIKGGPPRRRAQSPETLRDRQQEGKGKTEDRVQLVDGERNAVVETNPSDGDKTVAAVLLVDRKETRREIVAASR